MLSKEKRLTSTRDFQKVYQKGRRSGTGLIGLSFLKTRHSMTRVAVVVGKKFSKKAVERNRAKRVYREVVRELYTKMLGGFDTIIFLKGSSRNSMPKIEDVKKDLSELLKRSGLLK